MGFLRSLFGASLLVLGTVDANQPPLPPSSGPDLTLNQKVLKYVESRLGEKVGQGDCASLAREAFRSSGADLQYQDDQGRRVWGKPIQKFENLKPGDVLEFTDVKLVAKFRQPNGTTRIQTVVMAKHIAIVAETGKRGRIKLLRILHQNSGWSSESLEERQRVQELTFSLDMQRSGTIEAYRPVAKPGFGEDRG